MSLWVSRAWVVRWLGANYGNKWTDLLIFHYTVKPGGKVVKERWELI